jgi:nucleotide-binding universal stress UspA family protein
MANVTAVVLPLDGTAESEAAIPYGATLARLADAEIVLVRVLETMRPIYDVNYREISWITPSNPRFELPAPEILLPQISNLDMRNMRVHAVIRFGDPSDEILAEAQRYSHAIIVIASRGRGGLERVISGSVASAVLRSSSCPVLVVRADSDSRRWNEADLRDICVPLDGSHLAEMALEPAKGLARAAGARLHLVHVADVYRDELPRETTLWQYSPSFAAMLEQFERMEKVADHYLTKIADDLRSEGVVATHDVLSGEPVHQLLTYISRTSPDLLVMTSHRRTGFGRLLMGSMADKLMIHSTVPLLIVRRTESVPVQFWRELAGSDTSAGL